MPDQEDPKSEFLNVVFTERRFTSASGQKYVEVTAEATYRHDDPKQNPRRTAEGRAADSKSRKEKGAPGYDATHAQPMEQGAPPGETRNLVPFSAVMNRREIRQWEKENEELRANGADIRSRITFIHKVDEHGNKEEIPIAIRHERENLKTGANEDEWKKNDLTFGNFSSARQRLYEKQQPGEKPSRSEIREAGAKDNANYDRNRSLMMDETAREKLRTMSPEERRPQLVKNDKSPPERPSVPEKTSPPPSRSEIPVPPGGPPRGIPPKSK